MTTPTLPTTADTGTETAVTTRRVGIAALVAAATFVFGIAIFATSVADYTATDATPADSVEFLVEHQGTLLAWYIGIFLVFGAALVPLVLGLRRLGAGTPGLADAAAVFGVIWAGLMFATGMISNIGIEVVADLAETDATQARAVWSSIDAVTNGLGGGNELVGGAWVFLVSLAGLRRPVLPRALDILGIVSAVAGIATVVPGFEAAEMVFGLGLIFWFVGLGVTLVRRGPATV